MSEYETYRNGFNNLHKVNKCHSPLGLSINSCMEFLLKIFVTTNCNKNLGFACIR